MHNKTEFRPNYGRLFPEVSLDADTAEFMKTDDYRLDNLRRRKKQRVRKQEDGVRTEILPPLEVNESFGENGRQFLGESPDPEALFIKKETLSELRRALETLKDDDRLLIKALFYDGKSERGYAAELGISQKTVNVRKHKILALLKKYFQI